VPAVTTSGAGSDDLASRKCARYRVMYRFACDVMYDWENIRKPPIEGVLRGPTGQPFGHRIQVFHMSGVVGADYAVADRMQRRDGAFFFLVQRGIGAFRAPYHRYGNNDAKAEGCERQQHQ